MSVTARDVIADILARAVTYSPGFDSVNVADARAFVGKATDAILRIPSPAPSAGQVYISREDATVIGRELLATGINRRPDTDAYQAYRRLLAAIKGAAR